MTEEVSQNGRPVLRPEQTRLWNIPVKGKKVQLRLADNLAGYTLAYVALRFSERVEPINTQLVPDDWGYAVRNIRGSDTFISNHASGSAIDLNATLHPLGAVGTFKTALQRVRIHRMLKFLEDVVRWGGEYHGRKDEMHFEINKRPAYVRKVARKIRSTSYGKRILAANPDFDIRKRLNA